MSRNRSAKPTSVVVVDLAMLKFEWGQNRTSITAWSPGRKMIGTCSVLPGVSDREAVFQVLDQALNTTIEGPNGIGRLALYNPFTAQIAYNSVPNTTTFTDRESIDLDSEGTAALLNGDNMLIEGRELYAIDPSLDEVEFAFAAHRN